MNNAVLVDELESSDRRSGKEAAAVSTLARCGVCGQVNQEHKQCQLCQISIGTGHTYSRLVPIRLYTYSAESGQLPKIENLLVDEGCANFYRELGFRRQIAGDA